MKTIKAVEESNKRANQLAEENAILRAELRVKNQELEKFRLELAAIKYEREMAELIREKESLESSGAVVHAPTSDATKGTPTTPADGDKGTPTTPADGDKGTPTTPADGDKGSPTTPADGDKGSSVISANDNKGTPTTPADDNKGSSVISVNVDKGSSVTPVNDGKGDAPSSTGRNRRSFRDIWKSANDEVKYNRNLKQKTLYNSYVERLTDANNKHESVVYANLIKKYKNAAKSPSKAVDDYEKSHEKRDRTRSTLRIYADAVKNVAVEAGQRVGDTFKNMYNGVRDMAGKTRDNFVATGCKIAARTELVKASVKDGVTSAHESFKKFRNSVSKTKNAVENWLNEKWLGNKNDGEEDDFRENDIGDYYDRCFG